MQSSVQRITSSPWRLCLLPSLHKLLWVTGHTSQKRPSKSKTLRTHRTGK